MAGHGVIDVASSVLADGHGCWAFLDLWRTDRAFTPAEGTCRPVGPSWRPLPSDEAWLPRSRSSRSPRFPYHVPVVLLLTPGLEPATQTSRVDDVLPALLPTVHGATPAPAAAYNVAAQLLAREAGVDDRARSGDLIVGTGCILAGGRGACGRRLVAGVP